MGRKRRSSGPKITARKKITLKLIEREHAGRVVTPYRIMEALVEAHHHNLIGARICILWRYGKKPDADGRLWMGAAKCCAEVDRELSPWDFKIALNYEVWNSSGFSEQQMHALMDHQLCRCDVAKDSNGEVKTDEAGRTVYRLRKPDIVEFTEVYRRHGPWTVELAAIAGERIEQNARPLLNQTETQDPQPFPPPAETSRAASESNGHHGNGHSNGHAKPDDWRAVALETMFAGGTLKALENAGLKTMGNLQDWTNGGKALTLIPGIGEGKAGNIVERLDQFWKEHPEASDAAPSMLAK